MLVWYYNICCIFFYSWSNFCILNFNQYLLFHFQGTRLISPSLSYSSTEETIPATAVTSSTINSNFSVVNNPNYTDIDELYGEKDKNEKPNKKNEKRKRINSEDEEGNVFFSCSVIYRLYRSQHPSTHRATLTHIPYIYLITGN